MRGYTFIYMCNEAPTTTERVHICYDTIGIIGGWGKWSQNIYVLTRMVLLSFNKMVQNRLILRKGYLEANILLEAKLVSH